MIDCSKKLMDLSPGDAVRCFFQAKDWEIIGQNIRRMWEYFTTTTIGDWLGIISGFALLVPMVASYALPIMFFQKFVLRSGKKEFQPSGRRERKLMIGWALCLLVGGVGYLIIGHNDKFILGQGIWEIVCGIMIFLLGPSWWSDVKAKPTPSS